MVNKFIEFTQNLVKIDTTRGKSINGVNFISDFLQEAGFSSKIDNYKEGEGNLTATFGPSGTDEFILSGHIDTVETGDHANWVQPPFSGKIVDNELWGRGSVDMKGGISAMLFAFLEMAKKESDLNQKMTLAISAEEEVGLLGAREFSKNNLMKNASHLLVTEPTSLNVASRQKGVLWIKVSASGKQAHGSRPELGINAIENLAQKIPKIKAIIPDKEVAQLGKTTLNTGKFNGGLSPNIVPEQAEVVFDIRTVPGVVNQDIIDSINSLLANSSDGVNYNLEILTNDLSVESTDQVFPEQILSHAQTFAPSQLMGMFFATDAAVLLSDKDVPFCIFGPGSTELLHQTNERVLLNDLEIAKKVIFNTLNEIVC